MGVTGMRFPGDGGRGGRAAPRGAVIVVMLALVLVAAPALPAQDGDLEALDGVGSPGGAGSEDDLGLPDTVGPVDDAPSGDGPSSGDDAPSGDGPPSVDDAPSGDGPPSVDDAPSGDGPPSGDVLTVVGDGLPPIIVDTLPDSAPATGPGTAVPVAPPPAPATAAELSTEIRHLEAVRSALLRDSRRSAWGVGGHVKILIVRSDEFDLAARRIRSFRLHLKAALQAPAILFLKSPRSYVRLVELVKWGETTAVGVPRDVQKGYDRIVPVIGVPGSGGGGRRGVRGAAGGARGH